MASGHRPTNDPVKIIINDVKFEVVEDDIEPLPSNFTSKFKRYKTGFSTFVTRTNRKNQSLLISSDFSNLPMTICFSWLE